ncbi:MAG: hypothetical protein KF729_11400 [Sandaracinaceae bacterium]|nr:hypothetical protein [Sandaracinaceae bacterium]
MAKLHRRVPRLPNRPLIAAALAAILSLGAPALAQDVSVLSPQSAEVERLGALAAQLGHAEASEREAARAALASLGTDDLPAIRGRLEVLRRDRPPANWASEIMSRFRRRGRTEDAYPDIVRGAMAELGETHRFPNERARVVAMAEPAILWVALEAMDTLEAQRAALALVGLDDGLWLPEARGWVRRRRSALLALAIEARGHRNRHVRDWSREAFTTLGGENPGRAIPALEPDRLPDVLRAYADHRVQSAMRVTISYTGHRRRAIRRAARDAMRTYGGNGIWILRTAYHGATGEPAPREWGWERVSSALYAHQDAQRLEPVRAGLAAGAAAREAGDLEAMRRAYDDVLARAPELEDPLPVASAYALLGDRALVANRLDRAETDFRRALRLAPEAADAPRWRARVELVRAQRAAARGVWDQAAFARVLADDPEEPVAQAALAGLAPPAVVRAHDASPARARWGMAAALLLVLLGLALLWRPRRPTRVDERVPPPSPEDTIDEADATLPDAA